MVVDLLIQTREEQIHSCQASIATPQDAWMTSLKHLLPASFWMVLFLSEQLAGEPMEIGAEAVEQAKVDVDVEEH